MEIMKHSSNRCVFLCDVLKISLLVFLDIKMNIFGEDFSHEITNSTNLWSTNLSQVIPTEELYNDV